ncbi:MAG TPA: hypothetical protein VMP89_04570 [Solirubrobacteraceae bacterium]|nr:hypothetical protein [Solirubrobacteraceae bacterium]
MATLASLGAAALRPAVDVGRGVERRARQSLAGPARRTVLSAVDAALSSLDAALTSPLAAEVGERIRTSALSVDVLQPLLQRALDSPEAERLMRNVVDSRVVGGLLDELPDNAGLWALVDEIAQSPAVTEAISRQSLSFADQMAGVVRKRSLNADDCVERLARRLARRRPDDDAVAGDGSAAGE